MNPYAKFGLNRPSRLAAYRPKEHTHIDTHNAKYIQCVHKKQGQILFSTFSISSSKRN